MVVLRKKPPHLVILDKNATILLLLEMTHRYGAQIIMNTLKLLN